MYIKLITYKNSNFNTFKQLYRYYLPNIITICLSQKVSNTVLLDKK